MITHLFCCPLCRAPLTPVGGSYVCPARHTFDIARRGYVNLLTGRATKQHGDNKEMIQARHDFLSAGHYEVLMQAVADVTYRYAPQNAKLLDAGCGECSYTYRITKTLNDAVRPYEMLGIDISREALSIGAGTCREAALAVASLYHLPLADESIDMLFEIFAPHCGEEYHRVLKPGGTLVMAIPTARHLYGLKEVLYETPYENTVSDPALAGFALKEQIAVRDRLTLSGSDLWSLFTMTPYFYRTAPQAKEKLRQRARLETEIAFALLVYQKI